ncbi:MAG: hypothetical protein J6K53_10770 [Roseburia sp.]|nr:hypothetical protein [Roseburia sp.]
MATGTKIYTKEQLMESKRYADKRDLLSALLSGSKKYSLSDVDKMIEKYMKGMVGVC